MRYSSIKIPKGESKTIDSVRSLLKSMNPTPKFTQVESDENVIFNIVFEIPEQSDDFFKSLEKFGSITLTRGF